MPAHPTWDDHYRDEKDAAFLYRALAAAEADPIRRELFGRLAKVEDRHVERWTELFQTAGRALPEHRPSRKTRLLAWLENEFAWEADAVGLDGTPRQLTIHQCPFQDISSRHPSVCGMFFSTLIETLQPGARLEHAPNAPGEACCAFVVGNHGQ